MLNDIFKILGYDMSVFDAAFFKLLFDFVQSIGGPTQTFSPLTAAMINNKQLISVRGLIK
jgi:hypothetical protein